MDKELEIPWRLLRLKVTPESDPSAYFGFSDLHGFKDFVGFVLLCAPDLFPYDGWFPAELQMNLDRAFFGLRYGLEQTEREKGNLPMLDTCRKLVSEAYERYKNGENRAGFLKLEEMDKLLRGLHSE